jgi:hypothetical protein
MLPFKKKRPVKYNLKSMNVILTEVKINTTTPIYKFVIDASLV